MLALPPLSLRAASRGDAAGLPGAAPAAARRNALVSPVRTRITMKDMYTPLKLSTAQQAAGAAASALKPAAAAAAADKPPAAAAAPQPRAQRADSVSSIDSAVSAASAASRVVAPPLPTLLPPAMLAPGLDTAAAWAGATLKKVRFSKPGEPETRCFRLCRAGELRGMACEHFETGDRVEPCRPPHSPSEIYLSYWDPAKRFLPAALYRQRVVPLSMLESVRMTGAGSTHFALRVAGLPRTLEVVAPSADACSAWVAAIAEAASEARDAVQAREFRRAVMPLGGGGGGGSSADRKSVV